MGGSGMSALAGILLAHGIRMSGSDREDNARLGVLRDFGAEIIVGQHNAKNIPLSTEAVIHSLAIPDDNPELLEARKRGIPVFNYPQVVGALTKKFNTIAICGTHGKTTTTAMIAKILIEANFDPTVIVGSELHELGGSNFRVGKSPLLVLEACEYERAFLNYSPQTIVLTSLDPDHLDYYKDFKDYMSAFHAFAKRLPRDGYFFGNLDDEDVHEVLKELQRRAFPQYNTFTYSHDYAVSDYYIDEKNNTIYHKGVLQGTLELRVPGAHNRANALAAFGVGKNCGVAAGDILASLKKYAGAARRFELKGVLGKTQIIDDYGHHPAEVKATLQAAREKYPNAKLCLVFQPHQLSRTIKLLDEFTQSFKEATTVIVPNIYAARDSAEDAQEMSAEKFVSHLQQAGVNAEYGNGLEETTQRLKSDYKKYDVIMVMGAGDVWKIAKNLTEK